MDNEQSNVNNLNCVPNFGHGYPEEGKEQPSLDVSSEETNTEEVKPKKKKHAV